MGKRIIEFLENPLNYPEEERLPKIQKAETHISIVFLTKKYAYKLKKPVNFGFLDYSTLEKRKINCEKEVMLNRRMAEGIYKGVIFIGEKDNNIYFNKGEPVEFLVKMKRIPDNTLLSYMLKNRKVKKEDLIKIGEFLGEFHLKAESNENISNFGKPESFKVNTDENFEQTKDFPSEILEQKTFKFIKSKTEEFYKRYKELMIKRIKENKIRDCHGDIRAEHITFFENRIRIIDCIEFNDRFRYGDILLDAVFLKMELDEMGFEEEGNIFINSWIKKVGENFEEIKPLYYFYLSYRAYVRAKVQGFLYLEKKEEKLKKRIKKLFNLSQEYIKNL